MKILKILTYLCLLIVFAFGVVLFIKAAQQEKTIDYVTYVSTSSTEISESINAQSQAVNEIDNLSELSEEKIVRLEGLAEELDKKIAAKRAKAGDFPKVKEAEKLEEKFTDLLGSAEEANQNYKNLLAGLKGLESTDKVMDKMKSYNDSVGKLSEVLKETETELNNLTSNKEKLFGII